MATENNLDMQSFDDDDVIAFKDGTVKFIKLRRALDVALSSKLPDALIDSLTMQKLHLNADRYFRESKAWGLRDSGWFRQGVECEMLQLGAHQWKKGKLRLRVVVEFVADDEVQSLDGIEGFDQSFEPDLTNHDLSHTHEITNGNGKTNPFLNVNLG